MMQSILLVALGAVAGGVARFLITHYSRSASHTYVFPYSTLLVNILGCFLVGYVLTWTADHEHDRWRLLLATGFCGAFSTFSAFAYETLAYWHQGKIVPFMLNMALTNLLCMLAVLLGIRLHN